MGSGAEMGQMAEGAEMPGWGAWPAPPRWLQGRSMGSSMLGMVNGLLRPVLGAKGEAPSTLPSSARPGAGPIPTRALKQEEQGRV